MIWVPWRPDWRDGRRDCGVSGGHWSSPRRAVSWSISNGRLVNFLDMPGAYRSQSANSNRLLDLNLNVISFGRKSEQAHSCAGYRPHTLRTY